MGSLHRKILKVLKHQFPDLVDGLEDIKSTGRVTGWVASDKFDGLDDRDRQKRLWKILERDLTSTELKKLGPIVALTPVELDIDLTVDRFS